MNVAPPDAAPSPPPPPSARDAVAEADAWPHWRRPGTYVDPEITRAKLGRELALFRESEDRYLRDGVVLIREAFPTLTFAFAAPHVPHRPVVFGAEIDFDNYDAVPPSVRFVDPFSGEPLLGRDLPPRPLPAIPQPDVRRLWGCQRAEGPQSDPRGVGVTLNSMFQGQDNEPIFFCVPGTREYHQHPLHTGDSWFLHRGQGVGTLQHLLEQLTVHGTAPLRHYNPEFRVHVVGTTLQAHLVGLQLGVDRTALPVQ